MSHRLGQIAILIVTTLALAAIVVFDAPWTIRTCVILFAVISSADALAHAWKDVDGNVAHGWGLLASLAALMILRTLWFYAGLNLNGWGDVVPLMVVVLIAGSYRLTSSRESRVVSRESGQNASTHDSRLSTHDFLFPVLSLIGVSLITYAAHRAGTTAAIRTPWPLLPSWTLPVIGMLFILPVVSALRGMNRWIVAIEGACAIAAVTVIAPLVYTIGFGFDGFLHVAGERVLQNTGILSPKPMYYIGQYVTTTWLSKLTEIDIGAIDRWLVPIAAALMTPFALASSSDNKRSSMLAAIIFLPLGFFVATTPNGFAMVLGATALIASIGASRRMIPWTIPLLFGVWSALTHPLVGLPIVAAIGAAAILGLRGSETKGLRIRNVGAILIAILSGFTVPIVFGVSSLIGSQGTTFAIGKIADAGAWASLMSAWIPWINNHFSLWADSAVWIERILPLLVLIFAITGTIRSWRETRKTSSDPDAPCPMPHAPLFLLASASAASAAIILQLAGDFGFLIDYERGNYAARLWSVAFVLLLPAAIPELARWVDRLKNARPSSAIAAFAAIGIIGAGSAYAALPRHDAVTPSRGWSVSQADIDAVKLIDEDSAGQPYTVLANQSVSAAAVRTFGFKRYNGDTFFYPIPTGGTLYDVFLTASYGDPSRATMAKAANLGGSTLVYFAVNDYWWKADELLQSASSSTDRTFVIDDGKVTVFKYEMK
jgi:hypothetical protein